MASSDRSRSDRLEPLSGRMVSQMQAVSSTNSFEHLKNKFPLPMDGLELLRFFAQQFQQKKSNKDRLVSSTSA